MPKGTESAAFFFAPFVSSTMRVEPGWIDYNGHMNMAYYHVLFDRALEEALACLGLGEAYRFSADASTFTAECHVRYLRELTAGEPARVTVQLVGHDEKRIHFYSELRHARDLWLSATSETMNVHVGLRERKVSPFPTEVLDALAVMKAAHGRLPAPEHLGRSIAMRTRRLETGVH
jgi:acyl-CoA thioester hydrolase